MTVFPDDPLRRLLVELVRSAGLLNPARTQHAGFRLSLTEVIALGELAAEDALTQRDLGERLGLEKSTVSRLVAGLEKRQWLARQRDAANHRYFRLQLTPDGRRVAETLGAHLAGHHEQILGGMSAAEREALTLGLGALIRQMRIAHDADHRPSG